MTRRTRARRAILPAIGVAAALGALAGIAAAASTQSPPVVRSLPSISGRAVEGETLRASTGEWGGARPMTFSFQWRRCGRFGRNCADIAAATAQSYRLVRADVGRTLRVRVTARNQDGAASAVSRRTAVVRARRPQPPPPPPPPGPPGQIRLPDGKISIPVTAVTPPHRLVISQVAFTPTVVRSRSAFTGRFRVSDTRGFVVRGALVFVLGIPYSRIAPVPEQATATDGYATFSLQPTARLPLRNGFYIVMFTRARKPGDTLLAGVSTRRLVQVRVGAPR